MEEEEEAIELAFGLGSHRSLERTFAIVEAFKGYPNTLLFFSANEVIQAEETAEYAPPYLRAVTRDLRNYIKNHVDRHIPVGYSAADVRTVLWDTWNYMQCAEDGDEDDMSRSEVFGLNSYSWCGESDFDHSTFSREDGGVWVRRLEGVGSIEVWKLKPSLQDEYRKADLVISHAGACRLNSL